MFVDIYLQTLGLHKKIQDGEKFIHGFYLVAGTERLISDVGSRGVEVRAIYTRSDEKDGVKLAAALGFEEIPAPLGVEKIVLKLDFSKEKPSLRAYKQTLDKYKHEHLVEDNA